MQIISWDREVARERELRRQVAYSEALFHLKMFHPHNLSGRSREEGIPPNATTVEANGGHALKRNKQLKKKSMFPCCWCGVSQMSGRLSCPACLEIAALAPYIL